jgi:serine/threonine protein kinase
MTSIAHSCNDDLLRILLDEDDEQSSEFRSAAEHVDSCPKCQTRLEQLAADCDDWNETRQQLRAVESDSAIDGEQPEHRWKSSKSSNAWTESMAKLLLAPPRHPEMLGRLGRFEIERLIGSGGMGIVFKGFDSELNRPVAIKVLTPHLAGSGAARKRFAREARAAAAIVHEHVVAIHNVDSEGEPPFLVMQYVTGESLQGRLDREGSLSVCEILRIARQTALGLAAAHEQGIVHRDVKPSNILLEQGVERALLTDFGLARAADDASLTRSGHMAGTPHYMSPEQARGESVEQRSDLFSLGSVMYLMCTGRLPFRAESSYGILRRITDSEPRAIREINPEIPDWLCRIVERLLSKSPEKRYQSAVELAGVLGECLAYVQTSDGQLPKELRSVSSSKTKVKQIALSLAVCGILGLIGVVMNRIDPNVPKGPAQLPGEQSSAPAPAVSEFQSAETAWEPNDEPSLDSVQRTIEDLDKRSQRFFDPGPPP